MVNKKNIIKLTESELKNIITESVKNILNEFIAGGNDWGKTYLDYRRTTQTNQELDDIIRELHTICQYYDEFYKVGYEKQKSQYFPHIDAKYAQYLTQLISPIYSLFANRNNRKNDEYSMTIQDIKEYCAESLKKLSNDRKLGVIYNAATRALSQLQ